MGLSGSSAPTYPRPQRLPYNVSRSDDLGGMSSSHLWSLEEQSLSALWR